VPVIGWRKNVCHLQRVELAPEGLLLGCGLPARLLQSGELGARCSCDALQLLTLDQQLLRGVPPMRSRVSCNDTVPMLMLRRDVSNAAKDFLLIALCGAKYAPSAKTWCT